MFASVSDGLRSAAKQPKLVLLLWAWYGLLALIPVMPAWAWWNRVLGTSPEAATVLRGFSFGVWGELARGGDVSGMGLLITTTAAVMLIAWISSAFVFGGILEAYSSDGERRSFMHRFYRGGGHFFWRFLRLSIIAGACALLAVGAVAAFVGMVSAPLADSRWEPAGYLVGLINVLAIAIIAALFLLALDYARIRTARDDARGMLLAFARGLGFVLRNVLTAYGVAIPFVATLAVLMLCYVAYEANTPAAGTWSAIAGLMVFMQVVVLGRVFLRVALVGAERHVDASKRPIPLPAPIPRAVVAQVAEPMPEEVATPPADPV